MTGMSDAVTVQFGWSSTPFDLHLTASYTDETHRVRSVTCERGRGSWPGDWPPSTATIVLDNRSGTLDLTNGTYGPRLKPGRCVRIRRSTGTVIWSGYIRPRSPFEHVDGTHDATLIVHCVDMLGIMAEISFDGVTPSGNRSDHFINSAIDAVGFTAIAYSDDDGLTYLDQTIEAGGVRNAGASVTWTSNLYEWIMTATRSEGGDTFVDKEGVLRHFNRHAIRNKPTWYLPNFTITDDGAAGTVAAREGTLIRSWGGDRAAGTVRAQAADGTSATKSDAGDWPHAVTTYDVGQTFLETAEPEAEGLAKFWQAQTATESSAPLSVEVALVSAGRAVDVGSDHVREVCDIDLMERVIVEYTPRGLAQQSKHVLVNRIRHVITPELWTAELGFIPADLIEATNYGNWIVLDHGTYGDLGSYVLGY